MRRLALLGFAALTMCALASGGAWVWQRIGTPVAGNVVSRTLARVARTAVGQALAGEVLEFKSVPPESARALERGTTRRTRIKVGGTSVPPVPSVPETPGVPAIPAPPSPPTAKEPSIEIAGRSGDMMRIGQDIHIESDQTVTGDVVAMGGDIVVDGHVEGDVQAMGGDVYLNSGARVDGDVFCMGGQLHEQPGAQVGGQRVTALGPRDKRWERRMVHLRDGDESAGAHVARPVLRLFGALLWMLITTALAWAFFSLAPGRSGAALARFREEAGQSFLVGLLVALVWAPGYIAVLLLGAILCITLIGIPVALVAWIAYPAAVALMWIWGFAVGCAAIGQRVALARGRTAPPIATAAATGALALGLALFVGTLLKQIPSFGLLEGLGTLIKVLTWIAIGVVSTLGAGALVRHEFAHGPLRRWWTGRQNGTMSAATGAASAPPPAASPLAMEPPASAPPPPASPPDSFMPPPGESPPVQ